MAGPISMGARREITMQRKRRRQDNYVDALRGAVPGGRVRIQGDWRATGEFVHIELTPASS